jgi:hypothetical protein
MLVYVTNCRVGGLVGGGIVIPMSEALQAADKNTRPDRIDQNHIHDYYSIWFNFSRSHKTKNPLFHLVSFHEMLITILNCLYIWNNIKYVLNNKIES